MGGVALRVIFPRLYNLSLDKKSMRGSMGSWEGTRGVGNGDGSVNFMILN